MELRHTEVPPDLRRKGFARQLCKEVFKFAKEENLKIVPTCSFCHRYANEWATPEERELVVKNIHC
ncbi:unnamed protein product [Gongylonema pulchrum]|uniref:Protein NATD1 n=1 Tax=Gongylonema pulchrum TaxID=637853 RepID=A0A3P6T676_9BILA|nr:unnamed protein product [Gongylonema pulchrum]